MKNVKVCPECGSLVYFNYYFGAYICEDCEWEDASYAKNRDSYCITSSSYVMRKRLNEDRYQLIVEKQSVAGKKRPAMG